jgi:hypothetical protein
MELRDFINYAGFFIGVLGILLSIFLFIRGKEVKDPRCYFKNIKNIYKLSDEKDSKIKISYNQEEVNRVFTTYVWIWNNGKKPINKADIPCDSKVKINFSDEKFFPKILDFDVIKESRSEINFSVSQDSETSLIISFDFLDKYDGAVLEIQHTGSEFTELQSSGVILGVPEGLRILPTRNKLKPVIGPIIFPIVSLFNISKYLNNPKNFFIFSFALIFFLIAFFSLPIFMINQNPQTCVTETKLKDAVSIEFPETNDDNITNIMNNINKKSSQISQFLDQNANYFMIFVTLLYLITIISMLVFIARRDVIKPYPKSIFLGDNLRKFVRDKNTK